MVFCCLHVYCLLFTDGAVLFTCYCLLCTDGAVLFTFVLFIDYRYSCVVYMFIVCLQMELCVYMFIVCLQMGLCCLHVYYLFTDGAVLAQCTFDQGATCGFNQDTVDTFNWVLGSGPRAAPASASINHKEHPQVRAREMFHSQPRLIRHPQN